MDHTARQSRSAGSPDQIRTGVPGLKGRIGRVSQQAFLPGKMPTDLGIRALSTSGPYSSFTHCFSTS